MTSLALLIANYRAGVADYNSNAPTDDPSDAYAFISWVPPYDAIMEFEGPATNLPEALLALEEAEKHIETGDIEAAEVLIRAARLYLREVCV